MSLFVRHLTKKRGDAAAVDDANFALAGGTLAALLGPAGAGKSTLLRLIAGLEPADAGEAVLEGGAPAERKYVAFISRRSTFLPHLTVEQNIAAGLVAEAWPDKDVRERVAEVCDWVKIRGLEARYPAEISSNQLQ